MKSLIYNVSGKPRTFSDYIDYAKKEKPGNVEITLFYEPLPTDFFNIFYFGAYYTWKFEHTNNSLYIDYGGLCVDDLTKTQIEKEVRILDNKLSKDFQSLSQASIPFTANHESFFPLLEQLIEKPLA